MKIFLFKRIDELTEYYHSEGGLVVVANDLEDAKNQIADDTNMQITDEEWANVKVFELAEKYERQMFIFPDAGCCG